MGTETEVIERFGFDPECGPGRRHRGWWIVQEGDEEDRDAGAQVGDLCVHTRDGGSNPVDPEAFRLPNYRCTGESLDDRTYRNYYFAPLRDATS